MTDLAFPEIDEKATQAVATVEPKQATLKETALASFAPIVAHMTALAQRYRDVAFDLLTPKGMAAAKAARLELREEGRYAVQRLQKRLKDEANDLKRTIDAKAEEAIAIVKPVEDAIHEQIEAREAQIAAEKAERERIEAERKAKHETGIAKIRAYLAHCEQPGMTSARIKAGMDMLRAATFGPEWEEYAVPAANAQCETLEAMQRLHDQAEAREAAAAIIEAQRLDNERIRAEQARVAAELAAQQRALAEQAAELARQQAEIEAARLRANAPAANVATAAATEGKADNPEPGTLEAAPITQDAQESGSLPAAAGPCASSEAEAAEASPSGDEGEGAHADERASQPINFNKTFAEGVARHIDRVFLAAVTGSLNTTSGAAPQHASEPVNPEADAAPGGTEGDDFELIDSQAAAVCPEAAAGHAADIAGRDWTAVVFTDADAVSIETSEREAKAYTGGPVQMIEPSHGIDDEDLFRQCLAFVRLALEPRAGRFPSHPKPEPSHWAALYAAGDALLPRLAKVTGENV